MNLIENGRVLKLNPVFKTKIWGGSKMRDMFNYDIPADNTGECWAISAHPEGNCTVAEGPYAGKLLSELWTDERALFGKTEGNVFPLLTKIIDAKTDLSIQVHPDDEYAGKNENGSLGKTECWYVLDAEPGQTIVVGHNAATREELQSMIDEHRWSELIREVPIKKGDFIFIKPGTVHAIKGGTVVLETQQSSDVTYRLYDYDRLENGKLRPLHIKQCVDVINVPHPEETGAFDGTVVKGVDTVDGVYSENTGWTTALACCNYFSVYKGDLKGEAEALNPVDSFLIVSVTDGEADIYDDADTSIHIKAGDHFILTAGEPVSIKGNASFIISCTN